MKQMKSGILIFFPLVILSLFCCCNKQNKKKAEESALELTALLGGTGTIFDSTNVIYIATTIYNPTVDTIRFISMACSYEEFFTTNTNKFKVQSRYDCYMNFPVVVTLAPKERTDRFIMITPIDAQYEYGGNKIRVGMYYLTTKKDVGFEEISKLYENRKKGKILWSNELELKRLNKAVY